ncbi:hypothetical protein, partial [Streptomyces sp. NPDC006863]|uniref:hypothetical protein n=1 Tax=Streptomyces sp. NPDC006863 TaxID=3154779 RepID=UPI0033EC3802
MGSPNLWVIRFTRVLCGRAAETALKISLTARVFPLLGGGFGGGLPILIADGADTRGTEANSVCPRGGADRPGGTGPSAGRGNGPAAVFDGTRVALDGLLEGENVVVVDARCAYS